MKKRTYFLVLCALFLSASCNKNKKLCFTNPEILSFNFSTAEYNDVFATSVYSLDSFTIYYYSNGEKTTLAYDTVSSVYNSKTYYVISSGKLYEKAWQENKTDTFLFQFQAGKVDTLAVHCIKGSGNGCTWFSFDSKKYNGSEIQMPITGDPPLKYAYQVIL